MAHTPKNQSEKAILTARRAWCYLVLVLISFLCLFFFYVLVINSTRTHFEIQKGFSLAAGQVPRHKPPQRAYGCQHPRDAAVSATACWCPPARQRSAFTSRH